MTRVLGISAQPFRAMANPDLADGLVALAALIERSPPIVSMSKGVMLKPVVPVADLDLLRVAAERLRAAR